MSRPFGVPSPASCHRRRTVVVLGAGIAGLTAAHELVERGFEVTVYEPRGDERAGLGATPPGAFPPVKLGGLAASQYSTAGFTGGSQAELRPFPGRRGQPPPPPRAVAGEHGFRFFPAYYLHIWDLLQRIPVYQPPARHTDADPALQASTRTVMDNVRRVVTQATILHGRPSLIFTREQPRSPAELFTLLAQFQDLGFTPADVATFASRILRYLVTSPLRRASELQNLSTYDYFIGRDSTAARRYSYSPQAEALILDMPKVLAAFDSHWGDARTNISTFMQLLLRMDRRDDKADGVLNGPTTEAWFDHWYQHLVRLGVRFVRGAAERLEPPPVDRRRPPHLRPGVRVVLADGTRLAPDYVVAAVDAPTAERITGALRAAGTGGAVAELNGFTTSRPPVTGPLQPAAERPAARRDPFAMAELGHSPWDRFQTLAGIQYYFDTEFQLVRGHVFYSGTDWGLSSINQHGLWEQRPTLARDGYVSVLSVDIGDFNKPSSHLLDECGRGKAARDCTPDEIAAEVWRQIATAITSHVDNVPEALLPWPAWYALDRNLVMAGPGQGDGRPLRNEAPYLIPIVGDWPNRPGAEPWNPNGTSWTIRPTEDAWQEDLAWRDVWQARHGGYQVHHNSLVFAGTWTKTFTRMTTMEAACESARHAVNAILDHYIWVESRGVDRRENTSLDWRLPFGFIDQGFSVPVRLPSPAGDYCFVFDLENREPLETRNLRNLDSQYCRAALPHPLDTSNQLLLSPLAGGPPMTTPPHDYTGQLLSYLQAWRQFLEQASAVVPGQSWSASPWPTPPMPGAPMPPPRPSPPSPDPADSAAMPGTSSPVSSSVPPGAAPPGPPVPPVAPVPTTRTADTVTEPAYPRRATPGPLSRAVHPGTGDGRERSGPGMTAAFSAGLTAPLADAVPDRQPRSAYSWTEQPTATEATAEPAAASSLFAEPPAASPPQTWWETPEFMAPHQDSASDYLPDVAPPENQIQYSSRSRPPPRDPTPTETIEPRNLVSSYYRIPFRRPGVEPGLSQLNLPGTLSPRPVQFGGPGRTEIFGGDPQP